METTEEHLSSESEIAKSQQVRLIDVFIIAPILIYIAYTYRNTLKEWELYAMYIIGFATLYYNGKNYLKNK